MTFGVKRAATKWKEFRGNDTKHCKITRRFQLDIRPGTTQCTVECNSTIERHVLSQRNRLVPLSRSARLTL
jgi:hypothetical protein